MSWFRCFAALLSVLLVAGCASAPPEQTLAAGDAQASADAAEKIEPNLTVNADIIDPATIVTCRDMLKTGSNVIVTRCMTGADWERYEKWEERNAKEMLRALQGSAYR